MDIEERVERFERQNRNLKKGIILAVFFIGGFFGLGQISPAPSVIKAKEFQVIGDNGQVFVEMGADSRGHGLVMTQNAEGKLIVMMADDPNGNGGVWTLNAEGETTAEMGVDSEGDNFNDSYPSYGKSRGVLE